MKTSTSYRLEYEIKAFLKNNQNANFITGAVIFAKILNYEGDFVALAEHWEELGCPSIEGFCIGERTSTKLKLVPKGGEDKRLRQYKQKEVEDKIVGNSPDAF